MGSQLFSWSCGCEVYGPFKPLGFWDNKNEMHLFHCPSCLCTNSMLGIKLMQNKTQTAWSDVLFLWESGHLLTHSFASGMGETPGMIVSDWWEAMGIGRALACRKRWWLGTESWAVLSFKRTEAHEGHAKGSESNKQSQNHPSKWRRREFQEGVNGVCWMPLEVFHLVSLKADLKTQVCTEMVYFEKWAKEWGKSGSGELSNWHPLDKWCWTFSGVKVTLNWLSKWWKKKQWSSSPSLQLPLYPMRWKFPCISKVCES